MRKLIKRTGGTDTADAAFYRKNDHARANAKMDPYALKAWYWQVMATANESLPEANYKPSSVTLGLLKQVAQLSCYKNGPQRWHSASNRTALAENLSRWGGTPAQRQTPGDRANPAL